MPRWVDPDSAAGDESDHDVGGMAVEVLASPVIDGRGSGVGGTGGDLDVSKRDAGVESAMMNAARSMCGCTLLSLERMRPSMCANR